MKAKLEAQAESAYHSRMAAAKSLRERELAAIEMVCELNKEVVYEKGRYGTGISAIRRAILPNLSGTFTRVDIEEKLDVIMPQVLATHSDDYMQNVVGRLVKSGDLVVEKKGCGRTLTIYTCPVTG